jgi:hypothetical protein
LKIGGVGVFWWYVPSSDYSFCVYFRNSLADNRRVFGGRRGAFLLVCKRLVKETFGVMPAWMVNGLVFGALWAVLLWIFAFS